MNQIFSDDVATYSVSRLDSFSTSPEGEQTQNRSNHNLDLAIYDKGTRLVKKLGKDSYNISTIHIYTEPKVLNLLDDVTYDSLVYRVIEDKHRLDYSFYKAVANV